MSRHDDYDIPSMVPERDEIDSRGSRKRGASAPPPREPEYYRGGSGGGASGAVRALLAVLVVGLLATAGAGYFFYAQGQTALADLTDARNRLADLESRLSAVGEDTEETTLNILERLDMHFSEIDKLWAARNANRGNITDHANTIEGHTEVLNSLEGAVGQQANMLNQTQATLNNLQSRIQTIVDNIPAIENLNEELTGINQDLDSVSSTLENLAPRVNAMEQDIESINRYRLQNNQDVRALRESINQLQERVGP